MTEIYKTNLKLRETKWVVLSNNKSLQYKLSFKLVLVTRFLDTTSSNVNEAITEVLNSFFFFRKRFCTHEKHQKHQKHKHATKQKHSATSKQ